MIKPKILIGVTEVAGYFQNLFLGFKELGYDAGYLNVNTFKFKYNDYGRENHRFLNYLMKLAKKVDSMKNSPFLLVYRVYYLFIKFLAFIWCLYKYDVFIFGTCSSFFRFFDYSVIKFFRKKIIHVSLGSDSRPSYLSGVYKDEIEKQDLLKYFAEKNKTIISDIKKIENYADIIINYPQHAHFQTKDFINGNYIGFPTRILSVINPDSNNQRVRILHAPTRPKAKGSLILKEIINGLKRKYPEIELIEITDRTNEEVLEEISRADIIVDEIYSDLPLGGLGTEAGCFSKPVLVGGYYADIIKGMPKLDLPPSVYCLPDQVAFELEKLIANPTYRVKKGKELFQFINDKWNGKTVALKYIGIIENQYPREWVSSPSELSYLYGWGVSTDEVKVNVADVIKRNGIDGLMLNSTHLKAQFLTLISES